MVKPSKSLVVVIKGPDASAGLNPKRFNTRGVTVPTNEANTTTLKSATETTNDKSFSEKLRSITPQKILLLNEATILLQQNRGLKDFAQ